MYGYIYITTNLINGKKYVGLHRGNFNPNYHGSGKIIKESLKKYGKKNFKTVLIEECDSEKELNSRERYWIKYYQATEKDDFYNLSNGGEGFGGLSGDRNPSKRPEVREKMSKNHADISGKNNPNYGGKSVSEYQRKRISESAKKRVSGEGNPMYGKRGKDNPNYGRVHVHNNVKSITVDKRDVDSYLKSGWRKGKLSDESPNPIKGKIYVNNGVNSVIIPKDLLNAFVEIGWEKGKKGFPVMRIDITTLISSSTIESIGNEKDVTE